MAEFYNSSSENQGIYKYLQVLLNTINNQVYYDERIYLDNEEIACTLDNFETALKDAAEKEVVRNNKTEALSVLNQIKALLEKQCDEYFERNNDIERQKADLQHKTEKLIDEINKLGSH